LPVPTKILDLENNTLIPNDLGPLGYKNDFFEEQIYPVEISEIMIFMEKCHAYMH